MRGPRGWPRPAHGRRACRHRPRRADWPARPCGWSRPSRRPTAASVWSSVRSRSTAPSSSAGPKRGDHPPALLAVLLDRRATARPPWPPRAMPKANRLAPLNRPRRESRARCAWSAAGAPSSARRSTSPMATSAPAACAQKSAIIAASSKRMVGGRHQQRIAASRDRRGSPRASRRSSRPTASTLSRGSSGSTAAIRSGCWASTRTASISGAASKARDRPRAPSARRRPGSAPSDRCHAPAANGSTPGRDPASTSAVQPLMPAS